jgi:hypothetical protein
VSDLRGQGGSEDDISLRFGPGVQPGDVPPVVQQWRSGRRPGRRRRRGWLWNLVSSLVTVVIVGGVVLWLLLRGQGDELQVSAIKVQAPKATQRCDATVDVTGILTTNGKSGQVTYRWRRSDGNESGVLQANVDKGRREVTLPLHWTVTGPGKLHAVATLEVLSPGDTTRRASAAFDYLCS